jgi:hypothetical protein
MVTYPIKEYSVQVHLSDDEFQAIKALARNNGKPLKGFLSDQLVKLDDHLKGKDSWKQRVLDPRSKNRLIGLSKDAHRWLKRIANNTDQHNWEVMARLILDLIGVSNGNNS